MKGKSENCKLRKYKDKKMQSEVYENLDEESHRWLQWNIEPKKVESIIEVQQHGGNKGVEDNYVLLILFVASGIQEGLFGKKIRNGIKKAEQVNNHSEWKVILGFIYHLRKTAATRTPD